MPANWTAGVTYWYPVIGRMTNRRGHLPSQWPEFLWRRHVALGSVYNAYSDFLPVWCCLAGSHLSPNVLNCLIRFPHLMVLCVPTCLLWFPPVLNCAPVWYKSEHVWYFFHLSDCELCMNQQKTQARLLGPIHAALNLNVTLYGSCPNLILHIYIPCYKIKRPEQHCTYT